MRPDHRSRLLGASPVVMAIVLLLVASVGVAAKGPPPGKGPGTKTNTSDYIANCDTSGWSTAGMTGTWLGVIPSGSTVSVTSTVTGGAWAGDCPTAMSGSQWLAVTAVNGVSASTKYGQSPVYFAAGFFHQGSGSSSYLEGVDISKWQASVNFSSVKSSGRSFVIAKASEGWGYTDNYYATNKANARAAGLAFTGYHFARPDLNPALSDASLEADWFVSVLGLQRGMLVPALDLEVHGTLTASQLQEWVKTWVSRVYALTGVRAMIYTSPSFWETYMGNTRWFADNGYGILWVAHWGVTSPRVPAENWGGRSWTFWQYTNCGSVPGISGCVDLDRFNGTSLSSVTY
jgi:GH25 family lysozyme M1 (1,4-beta-N-acetylmuramidase)